MYPGARYRGMGRSKTQGGYAFQAALADARIAVVWGDAAAYGGRFAPNRASGLTPSSNLLAFPTGPIMNESGSVLPTGVTFNTTWTDADGTSWAKRLTSTGTQVHYFYRATGPALPAGTYGLRVRCRSMAGMGDQVLGLGLSTGFTSVTAKELDWTQAGNKAATTLDVQFSYSGTGDIGVRLPVSGIDIEIDRIQLYLGGTAAIPAWTAEVLDGGRKGFAVPNAISLDANGFWSLTDDSGGGWLLEPGLADHTYTEMTMMHVFSMDNTMEAANTIAYGIATPTSSRLGTTLTTAHVGVETNIAGYVGRTKWAPQSLRAESQVAVKGAGVVVLGNALDASGRIAYFNEVADVIDAVPWGPVTTNRWHVGAASTTQIANITTFELLGKHVMSVVWDKKLTPAQWEAKLSAIRTWLTGHGGEGTCTDFHVLSGDSNWTSATGDWTEVEAEDGYLSPQRNLWAANTSQGGTGVAEVWGNSPYPAAINPAGRFVATEAPKLLEIARAGRKAFYWLGSGTNDFIEMNGVPAWGTTVYNNTIQALIETALALHPNVIVILPTIIARGTTSGDFYVPAMRDTVNQWRRDYVAGRSDNRVFLNDVGNGALCVLGDQTLPDTTNPYLLSDLIHLDPARTGDAIYAAFSKATLMAVRTTLGIA